MEPSGLIRPIPEALHGGGLDKFTPKSGKFVHYRNDINSPSTSILNDWTFTSLVDKNDNIWVGTFAGISVVSGNTTAVKSYVANSEEAHNICY